MWLRSRTRRKKLIRPAERREAALRLMAERGFSQRRTCALALVDPKTARRQPVADNPEIRARLREHAGECRRFGYRRLGVLLQREGLTMNEKKLFRLAREEGLSVRRRRGRKRAAGTRAPTAIPHEPVRARRSRSATWSSAAAPDRTVPGLRPLRAETIPRIVSGTPFTLHRQAGLDRGVAERLLPATLAGRRGLQGHRGIEPDRQRAAALERFVIGWPVPRLAGGGCRSAHAPRSHAGFNK